jgi:alpha-2-macroglobulin
MKKYISLLLLAVFFPVAGQNLLSSRQSGYYCYIYRISDSEAAKIYKSRNNRWITNNNLFHTVIDSFPLFDSYKGKLPPGHYIKVKVRKNDLEAEVLSVLNVNVQVLRNNTNLCIQVYDTTGSLVDDALVKAGSARLRYDPQVRGYALERAAYSRILMVNWHGITSYFTLQKETRRTGIRNLEYKLLRGTPLKYIWVPVKFVIMAPVIIIQDISNGYPEAIGDNLYYFFARNGIAFRRSQNAAISGYFVFNKPKFMPGDTVKFKTFIFNWHGRPLSPPLNLNLSRYRDAEISLGHIIPTNPGSYNGSFVLADSLKLTLDQNQTLLLKKGKRRIFARGSFLYEDYELKNLKLSVRTDSAAQLRGKKFAVHFRATDENGLNIQDGKAEITLKSSYLRHQYDRCIILKDTLWHHKTELSRSGETNVTIPDSLFPEADFSYTMDVTIVSSDNEYKTEKKPIEFFDRLKSIRYELVNDSILFTALENGKPIATSGTISGTDRFGYTTLPRSVTFPCLEKINPFFSSYNITFGSYRKNVFINQDQSLVSCDSEVRNDSLRIMIGNPRALPFSWFIYRGNKLINKGYGNSMNLERKVSGRKKYTLSLVYLWSGATRYETYNLSPDRSSLKIDVRQPSLVFPGQRVKFEVTVSDYRDKPVKDVDLTALSYTGKFDTDPGLVFHFPDKGKSKRLRNNYSITEPFEKERAYTRLDYNEWKRKFSLDTIEYYKFMHHEENIRFWTYDTPDGSAQFAPFVVKNGESVPVWYIELDNVPLYFGWLNDKWQPYSFDVNYGLHFVKIRTRDKLFSIDSVRFQKGKKLVMSINDVDNPEKFRVQEVKPEFSEKEKYNMSRYLFPFRNNFGNDYVYLKQSGRIFLLNPSGLGQAPKYGRNYNPASDHSYGLTGPVNNNFATLSVAGNYHHYFEVEPGFTFEFAPSVIKMRSTDKKDLIPSGYRFQGEPRFSDLTLTEKSILDDYEEYLFKRKLDSAKFNLPKRTLPGYGQMLLSIDSLAGRSGVLPLFLILAPSEQPEKGIVYPGNTTTMENLRPGTWTLYLVYRDDRYSRYDSLIVHDGGRNYIHLSMPSPSVQDSLSQKLNRLIEYQAYGKGGQMPEYFRDYLRQVQVVRELTRYTGEGVQVHGIVLTNGEPLIGVNVIVKGTNIGTITDLNGFYSLIVPTGNRELTFNFIGFKPVEKPVTSDILNVTMEEEYNALDEVVVTAMGISRTLQGRVAGVAISNSPGSSPGKIMIRGNSSVMAESAPLYVIDGVPFTGDISQLGIDNITEFQVLKDKSATSLYGSLAANGVIMINTAGLKMKNPKLLAAMKGADYDSTFMAEAGRSGSVRKNFRDYAYWKPDLRTDENGKSTFEVQFPDDITSWSTYVLAMNGRKQSGRASGSIKSYKPLMAQLFTPRFAVEGDSIGMIGKTVTYSTDSIPVKVSFTVSDSLRWTKTVSGGVSAIDTLPVIAGNSDSIKVRYTLERKDGYQDGEERKISVYKKGLEKTSGRFFVLNRDTTVSFSNNSSMGEGKIYAQTDVLDVMEDEIGKLIVYSYECNEQMASKLSALLDQEELLRYRDKAFLKKPLVNKLIRNILKNQNKDGCWGWWDRSETSVWVTTHILATFSKANSMGYSVTLNSKPIYEFIVWRLESGARQIEKLDMLCLMSFTTEKLDYRKYIERLDEASFRSLYDRFRLIELKQKLGMDYSIDSVYKYAKKTLFGNIYFGDENDLDVSRNEVQTTLAAYRILRAGKRADQNYLDRIINYFLERRRLGSWQNTYETASIIRTILPDMLKSTAGKTIKPELTISGSVNRKLSEFPFELKTKSTDSLTIAKKGTFPVYLTSYQHYLDKDPSADSTYFSVRTAFSNGKNILTGGKPVRLVVSLKVFQKAQYVMLEIPIPAGCSYDSKNAFYRSSAHMEFFRDHVSLFFENLGPGSYSWDIDLLPRYSGRYTLNPAKAELMYFPTFSSNNEMKRVEIR